MQGTQMSDPHSLRWLSLAQVPAGVLRAPLTPTDPL